MSVLVKGISEVEAILAACPFSEEKKIASFFTLRNKSPSEDLVKEISKFDYPDENFDITGNCVYFFSEKGYNIVKATIISLRKGQMYLLLRVTIEPWQNLSS